MSGKNSYSQLREQLPFTESTNFNYDNLDKGTRLIVGQRTNEIRSLFRRSAQDICNIGQKLIEVKAQLGHGNFRTWLKAEFDWSIWTATKFMQVADRFKCVKFTHLDIAPSALYELAAPSTPEQARHEAIERASCGETITHSKAKAIARQYKQTNNSQSNRTITIDIDAETVNEPTIHSQLELPQYVSPLPEALAVQLNKEINSFGNDSKFCNPDRRSQTSSTLKSDDVDKTYAKFINVVEDMNSQLSESMEYDALEKLIDRSTFLAKKAQDLLNKKQQLDK